MTVSAYFDNEQITKDDLWLVQGESDYWEKAVNFVLDNWGDDVQDLSVKQFAWLEKIRDAMIEFKKTGYVR